MKTELKCHYHNDYQAVNNKLGQIFSVPEVQHISCNTGTHTLPDMSALTLGDCAYISGNALVPVLQLTVTCT